MTELMMALEATKDLTERDLIELIEVLEDRIVVAREAERLQCQLITL
jgi:hypothetical protein